MSLSTPISTYHSVQCHSHCIQHRTRSVLSCPRQTCQQTDTHTNTHTAAPRLTELPEASLCFLSPHSAKWPQPWNVLHLYLITNPVSSNLILIFKCFTCVYVYKARQKLETITALVTVKDMLPVKWTRWRGLWRAWGKWKH
jgi:hypothetical protein